MFKSTGIRFHFVKVNRTNVEYKCEMTKLVTGNSIWVTKAWLQEQFDGIPQYLEIDIAASEANVPEAHLAAAL